MMKFSQYLNKGKLLPFYNEKGMPDAYIRGGLWVNFNFRVNKGGREANNLELRKGLERYIIFWAHKNNVKLNLTSFKLLRKEIHLPTAWELNVLHDNFDSKWETIGDVVWNDNQATFLLHE